MTGYVGIDVSANHLDVVYHNDKQRQCARFEQTPADHSKLVAYLKKRRPVAIVMEATGIYYLDIALTLDAARLPVSVINPRASKHFAMAMLEHSKTDRIDARVLAEYAQRMKLTRWRAPEQTWLALRDVARRINRLTKARAAERNRLHAYKAKRYTTAVLVSDVNEQIEQINQHLDQLTAVALDWIGQDTELQRMFDRLISTKGIGQTSAVALLGELCLLPNDLRANQLSRHAGMDVRLNQSGSSLDRPGRLSKAGNIYLRAALHMPSLSLVSHDPYAKAHYQALVNKGKKKMQALCAVQRKMLTGLWACIQTNQPFDSSKLFAIRPDIA